MPAREPETDIDTVSSLPELYTPGRLICYGTGTQAKYAEFNEGVIENIFFGEIQPQGPFTLNSSLLDPYFITILDADLWNGLFDGEDSFLESISFFTWVDLADFDSDQDDSPPTVAVPVLGLTEILTSDFEVRFSTKDSDTDEPLTTINLGGGEVVIIDSYFPGTGPYPGGFYHGHKIVTLSNRVDYYEITNESQNLIETFRFSDEMDDPLKEEGGGEDLEPGQFTVLRGIKGVFSNVDPDAVYTDPNAEDNNDPDAEVEEDPDAVTQPDEIIIRTVIALGIAEREE